MVEKAKKSRFKIIRTIASETAMAGGRTFRGLTKTRRPRKKRKTKSFTFKTNGQTIVVRRKVRKKRNGFRKRRQSLFQTLSGF